MSLFLTQSSGMIIGPIAQLFGIIMNGIFVFVSNFGIQNVGVCLIIFTIIVNILMLPLTIKQQKFSKMSALMNPEVQAVQKKYKGKKDTASMQKMNDETQAVYDKYGMSPVGSCLPLAIQLPVIWGLYQVVLNVPAYVDSMRNIFTPLVTAVQAIPNSAELVEGFVKAANITRLVNPVYTEANTLIDVFYKTSTSGFSLLRETFPTCVDQIGQVESSLSHMNNFLGLNISDTPLEIIKSGAANGQILLVILAVLIPVLAFLTNLLSVKLMPQQANDNSTAANSLKTMNIVMPIFSAVLAFTFATGIGIYWIFNSLCGAIIRLILNKKYDKMDIDAQIAKNLEKAEKKREKRGVSAKQLNDNARISTKSIKMETSNDVSDMNQEAAPGSLREKANLVRKYNEQKNK